MSKAGRRRFVLSAGALLAAPLARSQADFPTRPLRILVGFAPGGATDTAGSRKNGSALNQE